MSRSASDHKMPRGVQGPSREVLLASPGEVPPDTFCPIPPHHALVKRTLFPSQVPRLPEVSQMSGFKSRNFIKTPAKPSRPAPAPGSLSEAMGYLAKKDKELEDKINGVKIKPIQVGRPHKAQARGLQTRTVGGFQFSASLLSRPFFSRTQHLVDVEIGESSASCSKVNTDDSKELICLLDKFQAEINGGEQIRVDVEGESFKKQIGATEDLFDKQKMLATNFVQTKKEEIAMLIIGVEEARRIKTKKHQELVKLDFERAQIIRDCEEKEELVEQLTRKKRKLEESIPQNINAFKEVIGMLENKLEGLRTKPEDEKQQIRKYLEAGPNLALLDYISKKIEGKERDLECPVCFEVASAPIFMCSSEHLVCSGCRDKLSRCPECRKIYSKERKKHRFAEKAAEELEVLYRERAEVLGD